MALTQRQLKRRIYLEKALDIIEATLLSGVKSGGEALTFNGRSIQHYAPSELENIRLKYDRELEKLSRIEAGVNSRTIRVVG